MDGMIEQTVMNRFNCFEKLVVSCLVNHSGLLGGSNHPNNYHLFVASA